MTAVPPFFVLSGCSGGGKSSLLAELARRGYGVVEEPGWRIVAREMAGGGRALPWIDLALFAREAIGMAAADRAACDPAAPTFFDRGLVDAAVALRHAEGGRDLHPAALAQRYADPVFLVPPWPEIFATDNERRHGIFEAEAEYGRLLTAYRDLGYEVDILPREPVAARADHVLARLGLSARGAT